MRAFYTDQFVLPLPAGHRFPMAKYALLRERVAAAGLPIELVVPDPASDDQLRRVHTADYVRRVTDGHLSATETRRIGFPWSPAMVERSRRSTGATIAAARAALAEGAAVNLAGGTHHAFPDHGEGFCIFNDVAVAVRTLQAEGRVRRVLVIDCDVHHGNGTAAIFAGDDAVFTCDLYGERNYPFQKEAADLAVPLPDETGDTLYLEQLSAALSNALAQAAPELVMYVAGADPFEDDRLGRLSLTKGGLAERDRLVLGTCRKSGVPVTVTMAGGYAREIGDTVDIHFETVRISTAGV